MERADVWQALRAGTKALADPDAPSGQKFQTDELDALASRIVSRARRSLGEARAWRGKRVRTASALLDGLLAGESDASLKRRARAAGLGEAPSYAVVVVPDEQVPEHDAAPGSDWAPLGRRLDEIAAGLPGAIQGRTGDAAVLVVPVREDAPEALARAATDLASVARSVGAAPAVAIGRSHPRIAGAARSLREAISAVEAARRLAIEGVVVYEDVVVPLLLLPSTELTADLAAVLDPLTDAGGAVVEERLRLLRAYIDNGCNTTKAGRVVGLPRETLRHRLRLMERDLGLRFERSWCLLQLALLASLLRSSDSAAQAPVPSGGSDIAVVASVSMAGEGPSPRVLDRVTRVLRESLGRVSARPEMVREGDLVVFSMPAREGIVVEELVARLASTLRGLAAFDGRPIASVARGSAGNAPRRALRVIELLREREAMPAVMSYDRALPFLVAWRSREVSLDIVEIGLGRLLRTDSPSRELFGTLAAYLEAGCSATEAAKALFIDPRTLHRRRAEAELVTGRRIADPHDRLLLEMGVRAVLLGIGNGVGERPA